MEPVVSKEKTTSALRSSSDVLTGDKDFVGAVVLGASTFGVVTLVAVFGGVLVFAEFKALV